MDNINYLIDQACQNFMKPLNYLILHRTSSELIQTLKNVTKTQLQDHRDTNVQFIWNFVSLMSTNMRMLKVELIKFSSEIKLKLLRLKY